MDIIFIGSPCIALAFRYRDRIKGYCSHRAHFLEFQGYFWDERDGAGNGFEYVSSEMISDIRDRDFLGVEG